MQLAGVHHVSINVEDLDATLAFYTDVLGLELLPRPEFPGFGGAWLGVGTSQIHLLHKPGEARPPGPHFAVQVTDLDEAMAELTERGIAVGRPSEIPGVCRQTFVADPSGNLIELNQPLA
jgi:catechol 2,3-dioxygenase-like lactoylglutathione lyase family enzyme